MEKDDVDITQTCQYFLCEKFAHSTDPSVFFNEVAHLFNKEGFKRAIITRISADQKAIVVCASQGDPEIEIGTRLLIQDSRFTQTIIETHNIRKYVANSDYLSYGTDNWVNKLKREHLKEWIEIPIYSSNKILGLVFLDNGNDKIDNDYILTAEHLQNRINDLWYLMLIATSRTETKLVDDKLRHIDREFKSVLEKLVNEKEPNLYALFQRISDDIVSITNAEGCDISILQDNYYKIYAQSGELSKIGQEASQDDQEIKESSISIQAIESLNPAFFIGHREDFVFKKMLAGIQGKHDLALLNSIRAWGAFPININNKGQGAISVCSKDWDFFTEWRKITLKSFCEKVELILSFSHLMEKFKERITSETNKYLELGTILSELAFEEGYGEMAKLTVHNIGNMLFPIALQFRTLNTRLSKEFSEKSQVFQTFTEAKNNLEQIGQILDQYKKIKKKSPIQYEDINEIIESTVALWNIRALKIGATIDTSLDKSLPPIRIAKNEFHQIFGNIITNALYALEESKNKKRLKIRTSKTAENIVIIFEDTGRGLSDDELTRLKKGEIFTSKPSGKGSGLGMKYIRNILEKYDGYIDFEGKLDKGAKIIIKLPI